MSKFVVWLPPSWGNDPAHELVSGLLAKLDHGVNILLRYKDIVAHAPVERLQAIQKWQTEHISEIPEERRHW